MNRFGTAVAGTLLLVAGGAAGWTIQSWRQPAVHDHDDATEEGHGPLAPASLEAKVEVGTVTRGDLPLTVPVIGRIDAPPAARRGIASRARGRVTTISLTAGQRVKAGDTLAVIDPAPLHAAVETAKAVANQAEIKLREFEVYGRDRQIAELTAARQRAAAELRLAQVQTTRLEPLARDHLVANKALDEARLAAERADLDLQIATQAVEAYRTTGADLERKALDAARDAARIEVAQAEELEREAVVRAPADGTVLTCLVHAGDVLEAGAPIATLLTSAERVLLVDVSPADAPRIQAAQKVRWKDEAGAERTGTVATLKPEVEADTGFVEVRVTPDEEGHSPLGLIVRGEIVIELRHDVLLVPTAAIVRSDDAIKVVTVDAGNLTKHVAVTILGHDGELTGVTGELHEGTRVVTAGGYNLPEGARVVVEPDENASRPAPNDAPASAPADQKPGEHR